MFSMRFLPQTDIQKEQNNVSDTSIPFKNFMIEEVLMFLFDLQEGRSCCIHNSNAVGKDSLLHIMVSVTVCMLKHVHVSITIDVCHVGVSNRKGRELKISRSCECQNMMI